MPALTTEQLLAEIEDLIRTMPDRATIRHELPENFAWFGRAAALVRNGTQQRRSRSTST
jgi:hypothetical protein